ncbi:TPA: hypothetical protein ACHKKK_005083, partial [Escherichia coli]|nr:hypothetical protein [Escherichia coli]
QSNIRLEVKSNRYYLTFLARKKGTRQVYKLEIDASEWDESKKSFFCSEYEKQRVEANKYYNGLKDKRKATKYLHVFFFGFPDEYDNFLFKASYLKLIYIVFLDDFDVTYNDKNYSIEKEQLIRDEINKEHLTAHQNRINVAEVADSDKSEFSRIKTSSDFDGALWTGIRKLISFFKK